MDIPARKPRKTYKRREGYKYENPYKNLWKRQDKLGLYERLVKRKDACETNVSLKCVQAGVRYKRALEKSLVASKKRQLRKLLDRKTEEEKTGVKWQRKARKKRN